MEESLGIMASKRGGVVSRGPPAGGTMLAQDCNKKTKANKNRIWERNTFMRSKIR